jgi:hypothetical protein
MKTLGSEPNCPNTNPIFPPSQDFIAIGLWLALGAMIAIVIFPFLALLFAPSAAKEA